MAGNHLEELVAEWYQYQGYFVRRNVKVGKRARGGYECELDVVAFHPEQRRLVHIEPSLDANRWDERERRYQRKFTAGRKYIPALFPKMDLPSELEQVALFVFGSRGARAQLAGGRIMFIKEFMADILSEIREKRVASSAIPEQFALLRTLQFAANYWPLESGHDAP